MVISNNCFSLWRPMSSQCCCWILQPGSDFSRCTRSEQPRHSRGSEIEWSRILQRWNEIVFRDGRPKHGWCWQTHLEQTNQRWFPCGLQHPDVTITGGGHLQSSHFQNCSKAEEKEYQAAKAGMHWGDSASMSTAHSIYHLKFQGLMFNRASKQLVSNNQETGVTSKASSVVSTRWRLPPLSPTQRQFPCPLMQIGKWLPGRATCTQVDSSAKRLTMSWEPFSTFCQQLCRISPRFDPLTSSTPIKLSVSRVCKRI